ncbi:hypothetical protein BKA70DRAFT_1344533 [Coprinopsis sp. MPI-PUGE-AT-0042]|nr:hypothetical protein BKA70DRAFT_1344533 [Coprinopsis sp. MPI-PUGE-AT-0042]
MSNLSTFPFSSLPDELQGYIFEIAVDDNPQDALNLTLVSRGANAWVQPRMFHQVILSPSTQSRRPGCMFPRDIQQKPEGFLAAHLRRLCMPHKSTNLAVAVELLACCTGLVDLAVWISFTILDGEVSLDRRKEEEMLVAQLCSALGSLHGLRCLSFAYQNLVRLEPSMMKSPPVWFANLKYLALIYWEDPGNLLPVPLLGHMQSLTHLSLLPPALSSLRVQNEGFDLVSVLEARPTLQVVLILLRGHASNRLLTTAPADIRIIYRRYLRVGAIEYWEKQHDDKWRTAEEEIARRRASTSLA